MLRSFHSALTRASQKGHPGSGGGDGYSFGDENHGENSIAVFESDQSHFMVVVALALSEKVWNASMKSEDPLS